MNNTFSIKESLRKGWELFTAHLGFFVSLQVGVFLLTAVANMFVEQMHGAAYIAGSLLALVLQLIVGLGMLHIMINVYDGVPQTYASIFDPLPLFWQYTLLTALVTIGTLLGLLLLVVPGVLFAIGVSLAQYRVIDGSKKAIDALKESWHVTKGHRVQIGLFMLALIAINVLAMIPLGLGLIVSIPVSGLAYVHVYRFFFAKAKADEAIVQLAA